MDLNLFIKNTTLLRYLCITIIILFTLVSCHPNDTEYPEELRRADSLCSVQPDSALLLLEQFGKNIDNEEEATQRYYQLLTIKAQDKALIPYTSDSLIKELVAYYEKDNNSFLLAEAYYYAGRTNFELGDSPQSIHYFHLASDILRKKNLDKDSVTTNHLLGCCEAQMGYVFLSQHLYTEAEKCLKQAYHVDSLQQDTSNMIIDLRDIGMTYQSENDYDKALLYYHQSSELAQIAKDTARWFASTCQETFTLTQLGNIDKAKELFFNFPARDVSNNRYSSMTILANLYDKSGETDSATYYYEQLQNIGSLSQKSHARLKLADRAINLHDPETALTHLKQYVRLNNEIDGRKDSETTALVNSLYNYNLRAQENVRLKQQQESFRAYCTIATLIVLLLTTLLSWGIISVIKHRKKEKIQNQKLKLLLETLKSESEQSLSEGRARIAKLEKRIESENSQNQSLLTERDALLLRLKQVEMIQELRNGFEVKWQNTSAHQILQERIKSTHILTENDWLIIEQQLQETDSLFLSRLSGIYEFSTIEWRVSILIKLHVTPSCIANLVSRSNASITACRKRLYTKVMTKEGKAEDWDAFVLNL